MSKSRLPTLQSAEWLLVSSDDSGAVEQSNSSLSASPSVSSSCSNKSQPSLQHPNVDKVSHQIHLMRHGRRTKVYGNSSSNNNNNNHFRTRVSEIIRVERCSLRAATVAIVITINLLLILGPSSSLSLASPESPAKLQRYRNQLQTNATLDINLTNRTDRVRRTNPLASNLHRNQECPSLGRIASLVPAEHPQACCDCVADHLGWHLTCFVESRHADCVPINAPHADARTQSQASRRDSSPLAGHRRVHRSPARWMGDEGFTASSLQSDSSASNATSGSDAALMSHADESVNEHEGFGEEYSASQPSGVAPTEKPTGDNQRANKRRPPSMMMTRGAVGESQSAAVSSGNNASDQDGILSLSSSNSITLMQLQKQTDSNQHQQASSTNNNNSNSNTSRTKLAQLQRATSGNSSNIDNNSENHPMFPTVPVLFSVTYTKNNMIVIDCDQAAPYYKPAMFQGFNVNEISSFTFNNCQLPKITFSAILLRTGSPQQLPADSPASLGSGGRGSSNQALKPNRAQRPGYHNLVRRQLESDGSSLVVAESQREGSNGQPRALKLEPKVKSLSLNLRTVVDQRTLIYLFTGLNSLEELELNYLQLNLTNYELDDLNADPTTPLPTTSSSTSTISESSPQPSASQSRPQLTTGNQQLLAPAAAGSTTIAPKDPMMLVATSGSVGPATRTFFAPTTANAPHAQSTIMRGPPTTTLPPLMFSSSIAPILQTSSTSTTTTSPTSSTSTTTNAPSTTSTVIASSTTSTTTLRPQIGSNRPRAPQVNMLRPVQGGSGRGTPLGSPRGLLSSGGIPTTTLAATTTSTTTTTTTTSVPITNLINSAPSPVTTTGPPTTMQHQQQHHRNRLHQQNQTTLPANLISVAASQSVSYTNGNTQTIQPQQQQPRSNQQMPTSSNILLTQPTITTSQSQQHQQNQQNQHSVTRLHQTPSAWFQPASTTTSTTTSSSMNTNSNGFAQTPASNTNNGQTSSALDQGLTGPINTPYASSLHTNGFGIRTSPASSASLPVSLALYNSNSPGGFRSATTANRLQQMQGAGLRTLNNQYGNQLAVTPTTTATSSATQASTNPQAAESTLQFQMVPGNGRQPIMTSRRQFVSQPTPITTNQQFASTNQRADHSLDNGGDTSASNDQLSSSASSSSSTFVSPRDLEDTSDAQTSRSENQRFKRHAPRSLDEFELSFGELLPSLKSLKLIGFIDLPKAVGDSFHSSRSRPKQLRPVRVRRQFQPSDVPEKDEGHMSDSESEAIAAAAGRDSLIAEETSVNHNSVMASDTIPSRSASTFNPRPSPVAPQSSLDSSPSGTSMDSMDHDGWLVSHSSSDSSPPPALVDPSSGNLQGDETNPSNNDQHRDQQQLFGRVKRLSMVLVKMFSKLNKLRILHLRSNDIPYWPDRVLFDSRHSLHLLYLMSNNIRQLGKNSLANLTELEALDLSANQLRQLNPDQFRDLVKLTDLRARRNLFRKFPASILTKWNNNNNSPHQKGSQLTKVDFSQNKYLTQLAPTDTFTNAAMRQPSVPVESLNLADCALNDQMAGKSPELLFASLPDLVHLSLQRNKLREILGTNNLFGKNNKLKELDMSHNQLTILGPGLFNGNASLLVELYLNYNQLSQIPEQFFFNLRRLRKLSLAHNKLNQLNANLFLTNQLLESLDLSHNQLITLNTQQSGRIPFGNGANLKYLHLEHNNLSDFELDMNRVEWMFYPHLQVLDLSHNKFNGQIPMPIFHTVTAEMLLNLSSNSIQSVNVDAQSQREHWDRYAAYEGPSGGNNDPLTHRSSSIDSSASQSQTKVPTVDIRLAGNPISCDCMLEPLISYSRRVALATNPTLVATIFPASSQRNQPGYGQSAQNGAGAGTLDGSLPPGSRYSVLAGSKPNVVDEQSGSADGLNQAARQPQVFYQFKLTDVYCAQPNDLQRQLLSHINIGDLLCPITDERICPRQCQCYYQSAFKTAIVDCSNKQLTKVPEQLTDASNFAQFSVESSIFGLDQQLRPGASADTLIIRLDNNKLTSMEKLSKLFTVTKTPIGRFARAPAQRTFSPGQSSNIGSASPSDAIHKPDEVLMDDDDPLEPLARASAQPLSSSAPAPAPSGRRSPVAVGRGIMGAQRSRRNIGDFDSMNNQPPAPTNNDYGVNQLGGGTSSQLGGDASTNSVGVSTAVLESAEEFRNKRYPMTCQLYLDHNLIDTIPQSFIEALDRLQSSSIQLTQAPPQAALPSFLVEPPIHMRLDHLSPPTDAGDPMKPAAVVSTTNSPAVAAAIVSGDDIGSSGESAFGRRPLVPPERKAALMEAMSQNVRLRQQQQQQQQQQTPSEVKWSVSPALVALSLRHNNLAKINPRMLDRLSKLIKSSNTQLYFGHNPINCTDNQAPAPELLNASPMGDLLAASDSSSGAYLEIAADDLITSASGAEVSISSSNQQATVISSPADDTCPIGQLQRWLTINHGHIRDLDELYCVHMSPELAAKLRTNSSSTSSSAGVFNEESAATNRKWEHDHPWASSLMLSAAMGDKQNGSQLEKNGVRWDSRQLVAMAKLINLDPNDLCPYSGRNQEALAAQLLSSSHQRALLGIAMVFMIISLCLLLMLIYFGDTQTMLAFVYIHMNPIYSCMRLNESHLDGDKLYDAFVSYSSADRDIVMELIERLEQQPDAMNLNGTKTSFNHQQLNGSAAIGALSPNPINDPNGTLNRRTNSFQDLSTMSRSTPRLMLGGEEFGGSALDVAGRQQDHYNSSSGSKQTVTPYRLCIHERDWLPGHMISWNISNSVQNSRRTILILSKEFIKSVWFQVEFHTAYYQMLEDRIDRLIVIVRGELPPKKELDKDLAFLLTTKTYLTWGEKWFWERLHYALPHKAQPGLSKPMQPPQPAAPIKRHHAPHNNYGTGNKQMAKKSSDLSASLSNSNSTKHVSDPLNQKPLIMSSIGKDLMHHQQPTAMIGSSSSSGSSSSNTRSTASFLSGPSTGNLLSTATLATTANQPTMVTTTSSDLLTATTRLTIGPNADSGDSGRVTATLSNVSLATGGVSTGSSNLLPGVTSIRLDGNQTTVTTTNQNQTTTSSSKARTKKQEKLQNFVDKSISTQLHLSEL